MGGQFFLFPLEILETPPKSLKHYISGPDQISLLLEQIQKMKNGLERLQEIALQFSRSESFGEDINYLIENIGPYLEKQSTSDDSMNDLSTKMWTLTTDLPSL